ncbi:unnamed protein product, partial [Brenthis ino]
MMPFGFVWAFAYFGQMFLTATPQEHWCRVPELEGLSLDLRRSLSIPKTSDAEYDHCNMFDANWTQVLETLEPPDIGTPIIPCQNGWDFLFEDIPYSTIVNEREWICDRANLVPWAQTIAFFGAIAGGIVYGILADKYGRLPVLILANVVGCVGGVCTIFTNGFWDFAMCRFLVGMSCDSCFLMIYIIVLEYVGLKYRSFVANMSIATYFGGGCLVLPWIALWISDWKKLSLAMALPMLLVLVTPFIVPESAKWLVSRGKVDKAVRVLKKFEKINKTKIPKDVLDEFIDVASNTKEKEQGVLALFREPSLRVMIIFLIITFMGVAVVFDGIIRLSENLGLDFFLTFTVTSATEIPSIIILVLLLDRFGRRWMVMGPMMISAILSFVTAFIPRGVASVTLAVIVRFFNNMAFGTIIQWTPELIPTPVRGFGASFVHTSAFIAITFSPFIIYSDRVWEGLSLIIVGVIGVVVSLIALVLPETKGQRMPQTMEDLNDLTSNTCFARMDVDNVNVKTENQEKNKIDDDDDIGMKLENIIKHVGEFSLYQWLLFFTMMPFGFVWAFVYFGQMFLTATPQEHWCRVPELEGLSLDLSFETLEPPDIGTPIIPCQNGWDFLFEDIPYSTIVNEREWVCDRASLVPWAQTIAFFGAIAGGIVYGILADKYGRLPVLILANVVGCVGGVCTIFTNGFWDFAMCRFLVGMSCDSCFLMIYIIILEYVGLKYRSFVANMSIATYFGGGCLVLPWIALWISDWKKLSLAMSLPMLLVLVAPLIVPESARWLVSKGKVDKAVRVLKRFEKINKTKIPKDVLDEFIDVASNTKEKEQGVLALFREPSLRVMIIFLIITFMGVAVVFDGIIRLSENLGLDFFLTFTVTSATEIPSIIILVLLLDRFGRRWMVMGPMMISGILSLVTAFIPRGVASVTLAVIVRFFINMAYGTIIQWTPELMPTPVRGFGASFVHISAFAAITVSPFIIYSERVWEGLSLIIVGVIGIVVSLIALVLPETMGRRMPQTMEDLNDLTSNTCFAR